MDVFLAVFMEKKSLASQAQADKKVWDNTSLTHSLCLSVSLSLCLSVGVVFWLFFFFFCLRFRRVDLFLFCLNPLCSQNMAFGEQGFLW